MKPRTQRHSLVTQTVVVEHDHKLNYLDPRLSITTHKTKTYLKDQLKHSLKQTNFQQYLTNHKKDPSLQAEFKRLQVAKEVANGPPYLG